MNFLKSVAAHFGVSFVKLGTLINLSTKKIGYHSTCEVFSFYNKNYTELSNDEELKKFLDFYIENWQYSYSQTSQDIFVMFITNMKKNGSYLEIGGADGFQNSNTISLNKHLNWKGVLVEPDNELFMTLRKIRKYDKNYNLAISPNGISKIYKLRKAGQLSNLIGFDEKDKHFEKRKAFNKMQQVKGVSINLLLKEKIFDYFSLDVEGPELQILDSIDWENVYKPKIITVEYNYRAKDKNKIISLLQDNGYKNNFEKHDWLRRRDLWFTLMDKSPN